MSNLCPEIVFWKDISEHRLIAWDRKGNVGQRRQGVRAGLGSAAEACQDVPSLESSWDAFLSSASLRLPESITSRELGRLHSFRVRLNSSSTVEFSSVSVQFVSQDFSPFHSIALHCISFALIFVRDVEHHTTFKCSGRIGGTGVVLQQRPQFVTEARRLLCWSNYGLSIRFLRSWLPPTGHSRTVHLDSERREEPP